MTRVIFKVAGNTKKVLPVASE